MKTSTKIIQFSIGVIPVAIFLVIAAIFQDILFSYRTESFEFENTFSERFGYFADIITVSMFLCMFLWVYLWAIPCKWFKTDFIYFGALTGLLLPAASSVITGFFTDDGNILTWIYAFTIGLILRPIGMLFYFAIEGIESFLHINDIHSIFFIYLDHDTISTIIIIITLMSLLLFKILKKKRMVL